MLPYEPRIIVYYCGSDDVNAGEKAEPIFDRFRQFAERVRAKLPDTRIFYLAINRAPQKMNRWDVVEASNELVKGDCAKDEKLGFIDAGIALFDAARQQRL